MMILWILFAVMTVVAVLTVLMPLLRSATEPAVAADHDIAVYKDQLSELDKDLEDGLINQGEAVAARTEIVRRLLRASDTAKPPRPDPSSRYRMFAAVIVVLGMPAISALLYLSYGSPEIPDQPFQARSVNPHPDPEVEKMIVGTEQYLNENRDNGNAWAMLGQAYLRARRGSDAVMAFNKAIELLGASQQLETGLGTAYMSVDNGKINENAKTAFRRAVELEPDAIEPRFFLAVSLNREKRYPEAVKAWEGIIEIADASAPWYAYAREELIVARKGAGMPINDIPPLPEEPAPTAEVPGPSSDDVAAAGDMSADDRQAMIDGMVSRLAERLNDDGGPAEDWIRLMRAYMVLKRTDEAKSAAQKALDAHKGNDAAQAQIKQAASGLGIAL